MNDRRDTLERYGARPALLEPMHAGVQGQILAALLTQQMIDPRTGQPRAVNAFEYGAEWTPIAASAVAQIRTIQISNTHDFLAFSIVGAVRDTATFALLPNQALTLQVEADSGNTNLTDRVQDWMNVVGTAQDPHYLPVPLFLRGGTSMTLTLNNLVATSTTVRIAFVGCKVFFGPMGG